MVIAPINLPLSNMTTFFPKFFRVASAPSRRLATKKKTFPGLPRTKSIAQSQTGRTSTLTVARWVSRGSIKCPSKRRTASLGLAENGRVAHPPRLTQSLRSVRASKGGLFCGDRGCYLHICGDGCDNRVQTQFNRPESMLIGTFQGIITTSVAIPSRSPSQHPAWGLPPTLRHPKTHHQGTIETTSASICRRSWRQSRRHRASPQGLRSTSFSPWI